jgi:hypothetical protein
MTARDEARDWEWSSMAMQGGDSRWKTREFVL